MAVRWEGAGARLIHVIDLDGAFEKKPCNVAAIERIVASVEAGVQVGGGIRSEETIEMYLGMGVQRVIIGTEAIENPDMVAHACRRFPGRIVVGIDARNGMVAVEGWTRTTRVKAVELGRRFEDCGVAAINFTDIHRDGMQTGPNIEATRRMAEALSIPIVASGGVSTLDDIRSLMPLEALGVTGVITGRAIYSGTLDLHAAIVLAAGGA
jgi:phosphoribosylformimino-5-aminoimidazole carboxamide ribotide isomerase